MRPITIKTLAPMLVATLLTQATGRTQHDRQNRLDLVLTAVDAGSFRSLVKAAIAADLVDTLRGKGPFTVFAPTDDAFSKLPRGTLSSLLRPENKKKLQQILLYHVVKGRVPAKRVLRHSSLKMVSGKKTRVRTHPARINDAKILKTDIAASNGLIHVIDRVLLPPTRKPDLVDVASKAGKFKKLLAAAKAAGLVSALKGDGPLTVFAPTDAAFAKLGDETLRGLLQRRNRSTLKKILMYHVVPGRVTARKAVTAGAAKTLGGGRLDIELRNGQLYVNDSKVIGTDIKASNGIIHVVDTVIRPLRG